MSNVVKFSDHQSFLGKIKSSMVYCADEHVAEVGKLLRDPNPDLERLQEIASGPAVQKRVLQNV